MQGILNTIELNAFCAAAAFARVSLVSTLTTTTTKKTTTV
jgi:hypothetical protein